MEFSDSKFDKREIVAFASERVVVVRSNNEGCSCWDLISLNMERRPAAYFCIVFSSYASKFHLKVYHYYQRDLRALYFHLTSLIVLHLTSSLCLKLFKSVSLFKTLHLYALSVASCFLCFIAPEFLIESSFYILNGSPTVMPPFKNYSQYCFSGEI